MKLRRTLLGAVLAAAATFGVTVPLAAPAYAASCTDVSSIVGQTTFAYRSPFTGSYTMDVDTAARVASGCLYNNYKYELFVFSGSTIYATSVTQGTNAFGYASFPVVRSGFIPQGTTEIGFGVRVSTRNVFTGTWDVATRDHWLVKVPGYSFDSATLTNARRPPCPAGYSEPCIVLPF